MKQISTAVILGILAGIQQVLQAFIGIKDYVAQLGWSWVVILRIAIAGAVLGALGYVLWQYTHQASEAQPVQETAVLADVPKTEITAPVKVYHPKAKAKVNLPEAVQKDEQQFVTSTVELPKDRHVREVSAVLDTSTGNVTQYVEVKPLPLFEKVSTGSAALRAGMLNLEPAIHAEIRQDAFTIKGVTFDGELSAFYTLAGKPTTFIGVGARYEW